MENTKPSAAADNSFDEVLRRPMRVSLKEEKRIIRFLLTYPQKHIFTHQIDASA